MCPVCKEILIETELFGNEHRLLKKECAHAWWEIAYRFAKRLQIIDEVQDGQKDRDIR
jgi:glutamine synthetase